MSDSNTPWLHVILYEPEIPPNTGNVIRLCANTGAKLHLIRPLGFELDDKRMRRAGLDYHEIAGLHVHDSLQDCVESQDIQRLFAFTTHGSSNAFEARYQAGDALLFGPETRGLPKDLLQKMDAQQRLRLPLCPQNRSLNLSNAVAIAVYEAWRQLDFIGAAAP